MSDRDGARMTPAEVASGEFDTVGELETWLTITYDGIVAADVEEFKADTYAGARSVFDDHGVEYDPRAGRWIVGEMIRTAVRIGEGGTPVGTTTDWFITLCEEMDAGGEAASAHLVFVIGRGAARDSAPNSLGELAGKVMDSDYAFEGDDQ